MQPTYLLLYVRSVPASAAFYERLLQRGPVESSPGFALFVLDSGVKLGLWHAADVKPAATAPGGSELAFALDSAAAVEAQHGRWQAEGLVIAQPPVRLDFGHTFTALDPDGHRLRVFAPA